MKYVAIFLVAVALIIGLNFVIPESDVPSLSELKIGAYVFADESITDPNKPGRNRQFCFKQLEVGKTYLLAPVIATEVVNLCFDLEFEGGIAELIVDSKDVQLSVASDSKFHGANVSFNDRTFGHSMRVSGQGQISANPYGSNCGYSYIIDENMRNFRGKTGMEHFLTVNAYEFDDDKSPVITAKLKLTQLYDDEIADGSGSRFYSLELVSYTLGDRYQMIVDSNKKS